MWKSRARFEFLHSWVAIALTLHFCRWLSCLLLCSVLNIPFNTFHINCISTYVFAKIAFVFLCCLLISYVIITSYIVISYVYCSQLLMYAYLLEKFFYDDLMYVHEDTKIKRKFFCCLHVFCFMEDMTSVWLKAL